jgi:flagellin
MAVISTNIAAMRAHNSSRIADKTLANSMERLSTGKRINSAKDDAAGLALASKLSARIAGVNQTVRNANDGISAAQIGEGAMAEIANILTRLRELAVQSASGTMSDTDRTNTVVLEATALTAQITNIAAQTEFNGVALLNGNTGAAGAGAADGDRAMAIQTGLATGQTTTITFKNMNLTPLTIQAATFTVGDSALNNDTPLAAGFNIGNATLAQASLARIDAAITYVASARSSVGSVQAGLETVVNNQTINALNTSEAKSRIEDADFSVESSRLASAQIIAQAATAMLAQANQSQQGVLNLLR